MSWERLLLARRKERKKLAQNYDYLDPSVSLTHSEMDNVIEQYPSKTSPRESEVKPMFRQRALSSKYEEPRKKETEDDYSYSSRHRQIDDVEQNLPKAALRKYEYIQEVDQYKPPKTSLKDSEVTQMSWERAVPPYDEERKKQTEEVFSRYYSSDHSYYTRHSGMDNVVEQCPSKPSPREPEVKPMLNERALSSKHDEQRKKETEEGLPRNYNFGYSYSSRYRQMDDVEQNLPKYVHVQEVDQYKPPKTSLKDSEVTQMSYELAVPSYDEERKKQTEEVLSRYYSSDHSYYTRHSGMDKIKNIKDERVYISLPGNPLELINRWIKIGDHPALKLAHDAMNIKRSSKQAYILLLGLSGTGKSCTMNYLFGQQIAPTSDNTSETRSTTEYKVTMESKQFSIKDLTLSVIDTPGFGDTEGEEQDTKNMKCIQIFLQKHLNGNFPNLVFLIHNITDNRMEGAQSKFSQMLRCVDLINAVDLKNPNLIVVLTHAASVIPKERWEEEVKIKKERVRKIVETNLKISPEIVAQENRPSHTGLEEDGDWHILPNKERQPRHLYEACSKMLKNSNDGLGHEAVVVCFRTDSGKNINKGIEVSSRGVELADCKELHSVLIQHKIGVQPSEVEKILNEFQKTENKPDLKDEIAVLKNRLTSLHITSVRDIQALSLNKIKMKLLPVTMNSKMEGILAKAFRLECEQLTGQVSHIGKSYNILRDTPMEIYPLVLEGVGKSVAGLPENVRVFTCNHCEIKSDIFQNSNEFVEHRLKELGVDFQTELNFKLFNLSAKGGAQIKSSSGKESSVQSTSISFSMEQKTKEVLLEIPLRITDDLKKDFLNLPRTFDTTNQIGIEKWNYFFEKWGFHAVIGSSLGGSCTGKMIVKEAETEEKAAKNVKLYLEGKFGVFSKDASIKGTYYNDISTSDSGNKMMQSKSLKWIGGNKDYFRDKIEQVTEEDWMNWMKSVDYYPEELRSCLVLSPLYLLLGSIDKEKAIELRKATRSTICLNFERDEPTEDNRNTVAQSNKAKKCFSEHATLCLVKGNRKCMQEVEIGDRIWSVDPIGNVTEDQIISWIHRDDKSQTEFLKIIHEFGSIDITENHIILVDEGKIPKHASDVKPGDFIHFVHFKGEAMTTVSKVLEIRRVKKDGAYAPLTKSGYLVVDGVAASCYCILRPVSIFGLELISGHSLAHFGFLPLRLAHTIFVDINKDAIDNSTGIHLYAKWMMENVLDWIKLLCKTD